VYLPRASVKSRHCHSPAADFAIRVQTRRARGPGRNVRAAIFAGSARTIAISRGGLNRMAASAVPARPARRAINLKGPGPLCRLIFVSVLDRDKGSLH
jgi:hypothetical protein